MKPLAEMELAPAIQHHIDVLAAARVSLAEALSFVQSGCEHRFVSEHPYLSGSYGKISNAHRICMHCRLIEEGSHWSGGTTWSTNTSSFTKPILGNVDGRVVLTISRDEFYKLRISA